MMKKLLAIVLSVVLLMIGANTGALAATGKTQKTAESVNFRVSSAFSPVGGTTRLFVDVSENSSMSAAVFRLHFDPNYLKAEEIEVGTVLQNGRTSKNITSDGTVMVAYVDTAPIYAGGRIFEVEFTVQGELPEDKAFLEVPVYLEVQGLKGYDYTNIEPVVANGFVTMVNTPYGDVNRQNGATPSDTLLILNYAVGLTELSEEQLVYGDVNGDGKVNSIDAMLILQYTAGVISNYPIFTITAPGNLRCTDKSETKLELAWDETEFSTGYNLYLDGQKLNETPLTDTRYSVTGLEQNTRYTFAVSALNTLKESPLSQPMELSTNKADRTVVFKDHDGTVLYTQIVLSGEDAAAPPDPVRTGYTFAGWDRSLHNITEDTVITATYTINRYTVKFDSCGGSSVAAQTKTYGSKLDKPTTPQRTDYTFMGWYYDSAYTKAWNFSSDTVNKNLTLFAKWQTWSGWSTSVPSGVTAADYTIQSRTETRYRTKSTTTDPASSKAGWTKYDTKRTSWGAKQGPVYTDPSNGSRNVWSEQYIVSQVPVYQYYHYANSAGNLFWKTAYGDFQNYREFRLSEKLTVTEPGTDGYRYYYNGVNYYVVWFNAGWYDTTYGTRWYYQEPVYTYYYYKWSDWSSWSPNGKTADANTEVQTRTVYRYIPKQK